MAITYEPIATTTLTTSASSVTFSSIGSGYTDLVLVINAAASTLANTGLRFNSDSGSNYSSTILAGDGSAAGSFRYSNATYGQINYYGYLETTRIVNQVVHIMNYSNSTTYKSYLGRANNTSNGTDATVGIWRNTNAITSVSFVLNTGTISSGSTFSLYGIAAA
jgi:hypothetical protein